MTSLAGSVWPDLAAAPMLVVPLGSVEQHGHHLPLGTDTAVACAAAEAAVASLDGVLLAPALAYGASGEHEGFPGTISIGTEALTGLLVEYGRSACRWAGPGADRQRARRQPRRAAVRRPAAAVRGPRRRLVPVRRPRRGRPRRPDRDVADVARGTGVGAWGTGPSPGRRRRSATLLPRLRAEGVRGVSPTGVLGDPTGASAEEGAALLAALVDRLVAAARAWTVDAAGRLREAGDTGG